MTNTKKQVMVTRKKKIPTHACAAESLKYLDQFFEGMENTDDATFKKCIKCFTAKLNDTNF